MDPFLTYFCEHFKRFVIANLWPTETPVFEDVLGHSDWSCSRPAVPDRESAGDSFAFSEPAV